MDSTGKFLLLFAVVPAVLHQSSNQMNRTLSLFILLVFATGFQSSAQRTYSHQDSLMAKRYFVKSWDYPMYALRRQLYLDSALLYMPTHAYIWQQKAMPLYKQQRYEYGKPFLDSAVKYDPGKWLDYRGFMRCIFEKSYSAAIADFRLAKQRHGERHVMDHPYSFYIGLSFLQLNQLDSSQHYFDFCIEKSRREQGAGAEHFLLLLYRGVVAYEKGNNEEAIRFFDRALVIYPRFSDASFYKAMSLMADKKLAEALNCAQKAKLDFDAGYTINEDNAYYEYYPYQIRPYLVKGLISQIEQMQK